MPVHYGIVRHFRPFAVVHYVIKSIFSHEIHTPKQDQMANNGKGENTITEINISFTSVKLREFNVSYHEDSCAQSLAKSWQTLL